jgi:putative ABC transport system permease protein
MVTLVGVDYESYKDFYGDQFYAEYGTIDSAYPKPAIVVGSLVFEYENDKNITDIGNELNITATYKDTGGDTQVKNFNATMIAVLPYLASSEMGMSNSPSDYSIYMDLDQFNSVLANVPCNTIIVKIDDTSSEVIDTIIDIIDSYYSNQVFVLSPQQQIDSMTESFQKTENFLIAIGAISLVVAGIGIMNIMTVSLMERTKEIGILKSLGAEDHNVLELFIYEAILIGIIGSIAGLLCGWFMASFFGSTFLSITSSSFGFGGPGIPNGGGTSSSIITPIITWEICLEAVIFGLIISIIFGILPAIKAARLRPIEALRSGEFSRMGTMLYANENHALCK